jgi:hypothetical protein
MTTPNALILSQLRQVVESWHRVETYGYDSARDGDSECSCGWTAQEDYWGHRGNDHYFRFNASIIQQMRKAMPVLCDIVEAVIVCADHGEGPCGAGIFAASQNEADALTTSLEHLAGLGEESQ